MDGPKQGTERLLPVATLATEALDTGDPLAKSLAQRESPRTVSVASKWLD